MKCPTDDSLLVMSDRSGIEIDYCPQCRGVWLDRGELDKIIERASVPSPANSPAAAPRVDLPREASGAGQFGAGQFGAGQFGAGHPAANFPPGGFAQPGYPQRWGSNSPDSAPRYGGGQRQGSSQRRPRNWLSELFD